MGLAIVYIIRRNDGIFSNTLLILNDRCARANLAGLGRILSYISFVISPL